MSTRLHARLTLGLASLSTVLAAAAFGCNTGSGSETVLDDGTRTNPTGSVPTADAAPDTAAPALQPIDAGTFTIQPTKLKFQTKSSTQLLNSVKACMGDGMTLITSDMLQTTSGAANPNAILPPSFSASTAEGKDDIITQQIVAFDGDPKDLRQGTRADALTLPYVTAQRNMANVVGFNCNKGKNATQCDCSTLATASAMLARCVPQLQPGSPEFSTAAIQLQTKCTTADKGRAVATFLASAAMSKLP